MSLLITQAITLQTFFTLILRWNIRRTTSKLTILGIWGFTGLVVGIPYAATRTQRYYGATGYCQSLFKRNPEKETYLLIGCWILPTHKTAQLMSQYLYMWSTAITMVILYGVMFLIMHGYVTVDDGIQWYKGKQRVAMDLSIDEEEVDRESKKVAKKLLLCVSGTLRVLIFMSLTEIQQLPGGLCGLRRTIIRNPVDVFSGRQRLISSYPVFQYPVCPYRFLQPHPVLHHPPCPFERYTNS